MQNGHPRNAKLQNRLMPYTKRGYNDTGTMALICSLYPRAFPATGALHCSRISIALSAP